jgi:hypothetical protein
VVGAEFSLGRVLLCGAESDRSDQDRNTGVTGGCCRWPNVREHGRASWPGKSSTETAAMPKLGYVDLWVRCPACRTPIEVQVQIEDDDTIRILARDLCPNELGPSGHRAVSDEDLGVAARRTLSRLSGS